MELEQALESPSPEDKIRFLTQIIESRTEETSREYLALIHYHRADAYHQQRQWSHAIADVEAVIGLLPTDVTEPPARLPDGSDAKMILAKSHYLLGQSYLEQKQYSRALKAYTSAVSLRPNYWEAYFDRAIAHELTRQYRKAIIDYNSVLELNPRLALAYCNRGTVHCHLGEHEQAVEDFIQATDLNPQDAYAHFNLGVAYHRLDRSHNGGFAQKAIASYSRAIELESKNAERDYNRNHDPMDREKYHRKLAMTHYYRAEAYQQQKQWDQAIADAEAVIMLLPSYETDASIELPGRLLEHLDSKTLLAKGYFLLGLMYFEKKEYAQAIKAYTSAVSINPDYLEVYLERDNAYEFYEAYQNTGLTLNLQLALAYYHRGILHSDFHKTEQAVEDYIQAITLDPQLACAHFSLGLAYTELSFLHKAAESYSRAIALNPQDAKAYYHRGDIYYRLALADLQKAAESGDPRAENRLKKGLEISEHNEPADDEGR